MNIPVAAICGPVCVDPERGTALFEQIKNALETKISVSVDFCDVKILISAFLNHAIGRLYGSFPPAEVDRLVSFTGLDESDNDLVRAVLRNARRFYSLNEGDKNRLIAAERHLYENI